MERRVAIVGAGPAGCAAAILLAQDGVGVTLVEANHFPRYRPGESLHPGIEPLFEKLGVADAVNAAGFHRYEGHEVDWDGSGKSTFERFGRDERGVWKGYQAWRPELDSILLERAKTLGVNCQLGCKALDFEERPNGVDLKTEDGSVQCEMLLDASGRKAWLSRRLNLGWEKFSHRLIARYGYVETGIAEEYETPVIHRDTAGWTWVAGIHARRCAWVRMQFDGEDPGADWVPGVFREVEDFKGGKGADVTWRLCKRLVGDRWFLLGDAAAVLDPAASHGVLRAVMSGMQVAHLITNYFTGKHSRARASEHYQQWLAGWFESDLERLRLLYPEEFFNSTQPQLLP